MYYKIEKMSFKKKKDSSYEMLSEMTNCSAEHSEKKVRHLPRSNGPTH